MQAIGALVKNPAQVLGTFVTSGSRSGSLQTLLGLKGSQAPQSVRELSSTAVQSMGYMGSNNPNAFNETRRAGVASTASALGNGVGQKRTKFTIVDDNAFQDLQRDRQLEFVGLHGTAGFAAQAMEKDGIDPDLAGKYTGGRSGGGKGIYTANSNNATAPEQAADALKTAEHYARRASLGEPLAFDKDTSRTILAFYRAPSQHLNTKAMPSGILGNPDAVAAFRKEHPAHEYNLGQTPLPRRLDGVKADTTLITDDALRGDEMEYFAVRFKRER
jgi:hypothetical protein